MTDASKDTLKAVRADAARADAPATVSNVSCGFDILGFALEHPRDEVEVRPRSEPGVVISRVTGDAGRLPRDPALNTAGVAVRALLSATGCERGVEIVVEKGMPLRSGLGSSAASAVAAVVAADRLLGLEAPRGLLLRCAIAGEKVACGTAHADNAAPCLYGGFVLVRGMRPPDVVPLPVPDGLWCALVRPHLEVATRDAREVLGTTVPLGAAVTQWGNVAGLVAGLYRGDLELVSRSLVDAVAEPRRAAQVPGFAAAKEAALAAGALGASFSGSGPTMFALTADAATAERAAEAMATALAGAGVEADRWTSRVGAEGARILEKPSGESS